VQQAFAVANESANRSFIILLLTIVFVLIIAWYLSKRITAPIILLANNALDISSGKTTELIQLNSNDEISLLADSFNKMLTIQQFHENWS